MVRSNQRYVGGRGGWTSTLRGSSRASNAAKWNNYRTRLNLIAERMQNVQIECRDALEILTRVWTTHDPNIAVYLDPPYLLSTRNGASYSTEASEQHHADMLDLVVRMEGPVVLSAYEHELYNEKLGEAGWTRHAHQVKASSSSGKGSVAARTEILWANRRCVPLPTLVAPQEDVDPECVQPEGIQSERVETEAV